MLRTSSSGSSTRSTLAASESEISSSSIPSVPSSSLAAALAASDGPSAHYDSKTRKTDFPSITQVRATFSPAEECRNFLKGTCIRTPCPYLHKGAPRPRKAIRRATDGKSTGNGIAPALVSQAILTVNPNKYPRGSCFNCGKRDGHMARDCKKPAPAAAPIADQRPRDIKAYMLSAKLHSGESIDVNFDEDLKRALFLNLSDKTQEISTFFSW